jgi:hypothetical protein
MDNDSGRQAMSDEERAEQAPASELEREERRLERLRLITTAWPMPKPSQGDLTPDPREAA